MITTIKSILDNDFAPNLGVEDYYFPEIQEGDIISYIQYNPRIKQINNQYDIALEINDSSLFKTKEDIQALPILHNLNYKIYQFKDLYEPAYMVLSVQPSDTIQIFKRWKPKGFLHETPHSITTADLALAEAKLSEISV